MGGQCVSAFISKRMQGFERSDEGFLMLIAHVSDFHVFSRERETHLVRLDAVEAARKVVADIASFTPSIDAVMLTGDLVDGGSPENYELLKTLLAPIEVPVFVVPGNHDRREGVRQAFQDRLPFAGSSYLNYEVSLDGLRVIGLDTLVEGRPEGRLDEETLDWLESRLAGATDAPTYVLMHHPPFPSGMEELDRMSLVGGNKRFAELVRNYRGKLVILAGHIHRPYQTIWNGAFAAVGGSPAFQFALDLAPGTPEPGVVTEPYNYFIHSLGTAEMRVFARPVKI